MKTLLIWGAGDQGLVTLDCAVSLNVYSRIDFLDMKEKGHREISDHNLFIEREADLNKLLHSYDEVIVATGDNNIREQKLIQLITLGIPIGTIVHPTALISPSAKVGKGSTLLAYTVIHTNAVVGMGCIVNTAAVIEHDCIVDDFVNISPKVGMAGHTRIGKKSFLGIGSTIIDGITIGSETIIGAGAVVIQSIPDHVVAVGVPARVISECHN